MNAVMSYLRGSIEELNHVRWPTRQQAVRLSIITILFMLISAAVLGLVDSALTAAVRFLIAPDLTSDLPLG